MNAEKNIPWLYTIIGVLAVITVCLWTSLMIVVSKCGPWQTKSTLKYSNGRNQKLNYCITEGCRRTAVRFLLSMNLSVDPCEDFYEYSCGLSSAINPIDEHRGSRSLPSELLDQYAVDMMRYLNELENTDSKDPVDALLKQVYGACMNVTLVENAGVKPLKLMIDDLFKNSPDATEVLQLIMEMDEVRLVPLELLLARTWKDFGLSLIFTVRVDSDDRSIVDQNIFKIDQASLTLGDGTETYYLEKDNSSADLRFRFLKIIETVFTLFINDTVDKPDLYNCTAIATDVLEFEIALANINTPFSNRKNRERMYNKRKLSELQRPGTFFNWTIYAQYLSPNIVDVIVVEPKFFEQLDPLLKATPKKIIHIYILFRVVASRLSVMASKYSNAQYEQPKSVTSYGRHNRSEFCLRYVTGSFEYPEFLAYAVGKLFVDKKNFTEASRIMVQGMVNQLKTEFRRQLVENNWMDAETKKKAVKKLDLMNSLVGNPDIMSNLTLHYAALLQPTDGFRNTVIEKTDSFFEINNKFLTWFSQKQLNALLLPYDRNEFGGSPIMVSAWYSINRNAIVLPTSIQQPPILELTAPLAINFGSIGAVIGHELTHGFDVEGSAYNGYGKLENWWSEKSKSAFVERVKCMIEQYSRFCYPHLDICVNGHNTQGENIADNGGIKQSFAAYKEMTKNEVFQVLPRFEDFTMDQLFFISFSRVWCANNDDNILKNQILTGVHAPPKDRVIGTLQNFDKFALAFNCPLGSRMNPKNKCAVW